MDWTQIITAYGTLILAVATVVLAGATVALAWFSRKSIEAIEETQHAEVFPYPHIEAGAFTGRDFNFTIYNRGRGPALDFKMVIQAIAVSRVQFEPSGISQPCFEENDSVNFRIIESPAEEREFLVRATLNYRSLFERKFELITEIKIKSARTTDNASRQIISRRLRKVNH